MPLWRPYTSTDQILFEYVLYSEEETTFISMAMELPRISTFHGSINRTLNKKINCTFTVIFTIRFPQKTHASSLMSRLSPHIPGPVVSAPCLKTQPPGAPRYLRQMCPREGVWTCHCPTCTYMGQSIQRNWINKVASHKCLTLKSNINPTHPTSWTLSHPKALGLPKPQIPTVLLASSDSCPLG